MECSGRWVCSAIRDISFNQSIAGMETEPPAISGFSLTVFSKAYAIFTLCALSAEAMGKVMSGLTWEPFSIFLRAASSNYVELSHMCAYSPFSWENIPVTGLWKKFLFQPLH